MSLPDAISPEAFAKQMGWSPKRVRRLAKKLVACRILSNRMSLLPEDVSANLEASKCPTGSSAAKSAASSAKSGATKGQLPATSYEDRLAQRTRVSRIALHPRSKTDASNVISMGQKKKS